MSDSSVAHDGSGPRRGWWRRNWWGVLALVPVLAALTVVTTEGGYRAWRDAQPGPVVTPGDDAWVGYAGTRFRLVTVEPADLRGADGQPFPLPAGLTAWQATVTMQRPANPDGALYSCRFLLEDDSGRLFDDGPAEAADARLGDQIYYPPYCAPPEEDPEAAAFEAVALFVLPAAARPAALRLTVAEALPAYVRFRLG